MSQNRDRADERDAAPAAEVAAVAPAPAQVLPNSGRPVTPQPVVISARRGDDVKTVEE